ncbi:hypothetical protein [Ruminiclostridium cellobioparum]|nr:hypothetical protein [Ruminiclostridium cellobioparum]
MRNTRFKRFKKFRHKKLFSVILFGILVPLISLLLAYILVSVLILPSLTR